MIFYECKVHGVVEPVYPRLHLTPPRRPAPICAVCNDTVIMRFKWTPVVADPTRRRVTRSVGVDASRPVQVVAHL